jgi:hypothetical protein
MKIILSCLLLALSAPGFAADTVTPHNCKKPKLLSRVDQGDPSESKRFDREFTAYKACITKYIQEHGDLAQAHQKAAKAAVDEINAFVAKANHK